MSANLTIDVGALDAPHRRALEDVIGRPLSADERLVIEFAKIDASAACDPPQSVEDWTRIYEGLSEQEIESIDKIAKTRANLTRDFR